MAPFDESYPLSESTMTPLVSFVMPVLNGQEYLSRSLLSIRHLECEGISYEVLILDNGSTDQTLSIIHSLGYVCEVLPKIKVSALRNRGVDKAHGQYLAFVDSDVEVSPAWLRNGLVSFRDPSVVAAGCFPRVPQDATWVQRTWDLHQRGRTQSQEPFPVPWLSSMNLIVRREAFLAVAGFNESLTTAEDVDLCYRLGRIGTILNNPAMEAVHWGEAKTVGHFLRKEVWRGKGTSAGVLAHGLRWDELPSLLYPLYIAGALLGLVVAFVADVSYRQFVLTLVVLGLLVLPVGILAILTGIRAGHLRAVPQLFVLYFTYGLARAYSLFKA